MKSSEGKVDHSERNSIHSGSLNALSCVVGRYLKSFSGKSIEVYTLMVTSTQSARAMLRIARTVPTNDEVTEASTFTAIPKPT